MSEFQSHFYRALLMKDVKLLQKVSEDQAASSGAAPAPDPVDPDEQKVRT